MRAEEKVSLNAAHHCIKFKYYNLLISLMLFHLQLKSKRAASDSLTPEQVRKHPRASTSEGRL